jgi:uncharacterized SAM-binding protein YcdF (DUF218 family)
MKSIFFLIPVIALVIIMQSCSMRMTADEYVQKFHKKNIPYDAIIVPGVPYEDSTMGRVMTARVAWAAFLYKSGIAKNVIFSGSAVYTPYIEAKIMAMMGEKIGIPKKNIFTEEKAEHSTENMYYGNLIAREHGFKRVAVASDPFQTFMLGEFNEKIKLYDMGFLPFKSNLIKDVVETTDWSIDPSSAKVENFVPITARLSLAERIKGTGGKNVRLAMSEN